MAEKTKIVDVALFDGDVLVVFSDGRVARLGGDDIYAQSIEAPFEPDHEIRGRAASSEYRKIQKAN